MPEIEHVNRESLQSNTNRRQQRLKTGGGRLESKTVTTMVKNRDFNGQNKDYTK